MSPLATRFIMVDDTDSGIQYTGPWFSLDRAAEDSLGKFGPAFLSTLHGVNSSASLSYTFSGSQVLVYGSSQGETTINNTSWNCFVDGISVGGLKQDTFPGNNRLFCNDTSLSDGKHTITLNVTASSATFLFDRIDYAPSSNVPLSNAYIYVDSSDPAITYSSGWGPLRDIGNMTQQPGATMSFGFFGTSLSWYSLIPADVNTSPSFATYTIDGGPLTTFALTGLPSGVQEDTYNQLFFQTTQLPSGQHAIQVTNGVGSSTNTTPLSLDFLIIQNMTAPTSTSSSTIPAGSSLSPSSVNSTGNSSKSKARIGAAVGSTVGVIVGVLVIIFLVVFFRKRMNRSTEPNHKAMPLSERLPSDGLDTPSD